MIQTTLRKLREAEVCKNRYRHLARKLGGIRKYGRDTPITMLQIIECNGLDDALWALGHACGDCDRLLRLLACDYAEHVLPIWKKEYPNDLRTRQVIETSRKFANGEATFEELHAVRYAAACAAAYSDRCAAMAAVDAAVDTARYAAVDTAVYAALAARAAADADGDAEQQWQTEHTIEVLRGDNDSLNHKYSNSKRNP